jgi:hypothetical protein
MIAALFIEQEFASANSKHNPLTNIDATAIVCRVDENAFSSAFDSNESGKLQEILDQPFKNKNQPIISEIQEWTSTLEAKFRRVAEAKALNNLSLKGKAQFEKLMALRRQFKNPRTGEEVLVEYQQRILTRKLVTVLAEYVNFHKLSHHSG